MGVSRMMNEKSKALRLRFNTVKYLPLYLPIVALDSQCNVGIEVMIP